MRPYKIKIAPGSAYELSAVGDYVRIKSASVAITVEAPEQNESAEMEQGDDATLSAFSRLRLSHADAAEQSVTVYIGKGTRAGSSKVGGAISVVGGSISVVGGSISVSNIPANGGAFANTGKTVINASAQLLAANASRRFLLIQNKDPGGNIWVTLDGSAATEGNGVKIVPGGSLILDSYAPTGAIYAIGDIASNANIVTVEG